MLDRDRFCGALFGLAIGDAVGTSVEFQPRGTFAPLTGIICGGPFQLEGLQIWATMPIPPLLSRAKWLAPGMGIAEFQNPGVSAAALPKKSSLWPTSSISWQSRPEPKY